MGGRESEREGGIELTYQGPGTEGTYIMKKNKKTSEWQIEMYGLFGQAYVHERATEHRRQMYAYDYHGPTPLH